MNTTAIRRPFVAFNPSGEHEVAGEIRVAATKSIKHPRPKARPELAGRSKEMNATFIVCGKRSVATAHDTKLICNLLKMRKKIADL